MRKDSVDAQPVAILASGFSRRHTLLVVQTDAWDRYGDHATLCSSSFWVVEQAAKPSRDALLGTPAVFRRAVAHSREAILSIHRLAEFESAQRPV